MHVEPGQFLADFNHRLFGALQSRHEHDRDTIDLGEAVLYGSARHV